MPYVDPMTYLPKREDLMVEEFGGYSDNSSSSRRGLIMPLSWWGVSGASRTPSPHIRWSWRFDVKDNPEDDVAENYYEFRYNSNVNWSNNDVPAYASGRLTVGELSLFAEVAVESLGNTAKVQRLVNFTLNQLQVERQFLEDSAQKLYSIPPTLF